MLKCFNQASNILLSSLSDNRDKDKDSNNNNNNNLLSQLQIPLDPQEFYKDFGYLLHPKTGEFVQQLTDYQYKIWNSKTKYRVVIKSQKVGLSTSSLLEDFHKALTTCKGKDILIIA